MVGDSFVNLRYQNIRLFACRSNADLREPNDDALAQLLRSLHLFRTVPAQDGIIIIDRALISYMKKK